MNPLGPNLVALEIIRYSWRRNGYIVCCGSASIRDALWRTGSGLAQPIRGRHHRHSPGCLPRPAAGNTEAMPICERTGGAAAEDLSEGAGEMGVGWQGFRPCLMAPPKSTKPSKGGNGNDGRLRDRSSPQVCTAPCSGRRACGSGRSPSQHLGMAGPHRRKTTAQNIRLYVRIAESG